MGCSYSRCHMIKTSHLVDTRNSQHTAISSYVWRFSNNQKLDIHHYGMTTIIEEPNEEDKSFLNQKH